MDDSTNIAVVLREIAANAKSRTGKILKKINRLAAKGEYFTSIEITEDEYDRFDTSRKTPLVEKLLLLGFRLSRYSKRCWWDYSERTYHLKIEW